MLYAFYISDTLQKFKKILNIVVVNVQLECYVEGEKGWLPFASNK